MSKAEKEMLNNDSIYPLTEPQKRIWFTQMIYPESSMFVIGGVVTICGEINPLILMQAICSFVNEHDSFSIRLLMKDGNPVQFFSGEMLTKIDILDFSSEPDPQASADKLVNAELRTSFKLIGNPLYSFKLLRLDLKTYGYMVKVHHIIADGWSIQILTNGISDIYRRLLTGCEGQNVEIPQYKDFIQSDTEYILSEKYQKDKLFWNQLFEEFPEVLPVVDGNINGNRDTYFLDSQKSDQIREFCSIQGITLNTFFISIYLIYVYKYTGNKDIVIGTPVLGRSKKKERDTFGMFVSSIPLRYQITEQMTIIQMMKNVEKVMRKNYSYQRYPYNHLVKDLKLAQKGYYGLHNVHINYYSTTMSNEIDGVPTKNVEFYNNQQDYSMQIIIRNWIDRKGFQLDFDYKISDYASQEINNLFTRLEILIDIVLSSNTILKNLCLLSNRELDKMVYKYNDTFQVYPNGTVVDLFIHQAVLTPDRTAVLQDDVIMSYSELNSVSDQLAGYLQENGIINNGIVAIITTHSIETIIAILAVLKAGGTYLPIDSECPKERMLFMLEDAQAELVLTNIQELVCTLTSYKVLYLPEIDLYLNDYMLNNKNSVKPEDAAYIIYTSGSTGNPKGVVIEHNSLKNYIYWAKDNYLTKDNEVFPLYSNLAFDLTVTSIFTPLISGGTIIVYRKSTDEYVLEKILKDDKCTIIKLTPTHLTLLKDRDNCNCSLQKIIVGGENLTVELAQSVSDSFGGNISIFNEYGPTEATVGCMIYKYNPSSTLGISVPIGKPAGNCKIYLFDQNMNPVPPGGVGEIYISSAVLARGYLNRPEQTADVFIKHPTWGDGKLYKTGDLAKFIDEQCMVYIGRADEQVKLNGYRIELKEIEYKISQHKGISKVLVLPWKNTGEMLSLAAYYTSDENIYEEEIRSFLETSLPAYMIPEIFISVSEFHVTQNGKIDKKRLPDPVQYLKTKKTIQGTVKKEDALLLVVSTVLNVDKQNLLSNFYQLGGDSIKAIQISSKLAQQGYNLKVKDILAHPVLYDMAYFIECESQINDIQSTREGNVIATPIIEWFFENVQNINMYVQFVQLELKYKYNVSDLEDLLTHLIRHHYSLQLNFNPHTKKLYYNQKHLHEKVRIQEVFLKNIYDIVDYHKTMIQEMDVSTECLLKSMLVHLDDGPDIMTIYIHHIVVDGISWRVILDDLQTLLEQVEKKQNLMLPIKTASFMQWSTLLSSMNPDFITEKKYWEGFLAGPLRCVSPKERMPAMNISKIFKQEFNNLMNDMANRPYHTKTEELLLTALTVAISRVTGRNNLVIEMESHGRNEVVDNIDISRTVGWFSYLYPVHVNVIEDNVHGLVKAVKESIRHTPNQGIGFGLCPQLENRWANERQWIRFNYLGELQQEYNYFNVEFYDAFTHLPECREVTCCLEINCMRIKNRLHVNIRFFEEIIPYSSVEDILTNFETEFLKVVTELSLCESTYFTPSDFDTIDISQEELDLLFEKT